MKSVVFYAPLKPPTYPTPSGDRQIARNLMQALGHALGGPVTLASELRSHEPKGDPLAQAALAAEAELEIARLSKMPQRPDIWVSYHNYYKAPDLIGPSVSRAFGIPYVLIEASRAQSRLSGGWAGFARKAEDASDAAHVIFHFTEQDRFALERDRVADQQIVALPPFLDRATLPPASACEGAMLAIGMMRAGDKMASYRLIAETLAHLTTRDWQLDIAGDGAASAEIHALFAPFGARIRFLGERTAQQLQGDMANAALLIWPGVNEAFGMIYLEAQAAGLPIAAQDRPGVRDVLPPGNYPAPEEGAKALARQVDILLQDPSLRRTRGQQGRQQAEAQHLLPAAAQRLATVLMPLIGDRS
ncbi:MAG: glycosyltransferase family 4 protein [Aestuariivita sp.]|uniref:glycosyltransferase family 4 protein n=1 Tax=Aestuariivita sp. TaxID=1872407 RepID=UPI003BAE4226